VLVRMLAEMERRQWSRHQPIDLFAALLDIGLDEFLCVLLEHGVDLIEQIIQLSLEVRGVRSVLSGRRLRSISERWGTPTRGSWPATRTS